jgi:hypothetical protein
MVWDLVNPDSANVIIPGALRTKGVADVEKIGQIRMLSWEVRMGQRVLLLRR